jgi:hypothetical protein
MNASNRQDGDGIAFSNLALALLAVGFLFLVLAVAVFFNSGPPQTEAKLCLSLAGCLEGVAFVLGVIGRRSVRGKIAIVGAVMLFVLACLMLGLLILLLRMPLGI